MFRVRGVAYSEFFWGGWKGITFWHIFPAELLWGKSRNKNNSREFGGMLHRKFFENSGSVIAILVLFVQLLRKIYLNFLPLILSPSPSMMHFVRTFRLICLLDVKIFVIEEVQNYGKIVFTKNTVEKWLVGECIPHISPPQPLDPPLLIPNLN